MKRLLAAATLFAVVLGGLMPARAAAPGACDAERIVSSVPFFAKDMLRAEGSGLAFHHRDDARIYVAFAASEAQPLGAVTRTEYVESLQDRGRSAVSAAAATGGFAVPAVFPFDPVAYRVVSADAQRGLLVGQMFVHVSETCLLSATFVAPNAAPYRSRWNALIVALDAVRDASARFGAPLNFAPESNAPTGTDAYLLGLAMPLVLGMFIAMFLGRLHGSTPPGAVGRTVLTLSAVAASATLGAHAAGTSGILLPTETALLLGATGMLTMIGATVSWNVVSLAGAGLAAASGIALGAYAVAGWVGHPTLPLVVSFVLFVNGLAAAFAWGRESLRREHSLA